VAHLHAAGAFGVFRAIHRGEHLRSARTAFWSELVEGATAGKRFNDASIEDPRIHARQQIVEV
jgi:hypothetical protein